MPRSPNTSPDGDADGNAIIPRNPVLRQAETRDLEAAADELRERTMTLERDEMLPAKKLVFIVMAVGAATAFGTIVFRGELRALLGLG